MVAHTALFVESHAVPPAQNGNGTAAYIDQLDEAQKVLVHELAHELLHHTGAAIPSKVVRETEAEAVAFTVSTAIGLSAEQSAANYIHLNQGDAETLAASLQRIQKVAAEILSGITDAPEAVAAA